MADSGLILRAGRLAKETDVCAAAHGVGGDERVSPQRPGGGAGHLRGGHTAGDILILCITLGSLLGTDPHFVEFPIMP